MGGLPPSQRQELLQGWAEAAVTWRLEGLWGESDDAVSQRARQGPPR